MVIMVKRITLKKKKKAPGLYLEMLFYQLASLSCLNSPAQQN